MKVHVVMRPLAEDSGSALERVSGFAQRVEAHGFDGVWVNDTFGRGYPTLDPIVMLTVAAAVTRDIEIGTCVLQIPVRHPVELAHRIEGLHALAGSRLQLGVGAGSRQAEFDLVGADFAGRFAAAVSALDTMRQAWRGQPLPGGYFAPWPGTEGGPAVLFGAWRNRDRITYAAERCDGWLASAIHPAPDELEAGVRHFRDAGGKRAVLSNVIVDVNRTGDAVFLGGGASVMLTDGEAAARRTLRWIQDAGFDDVLCLVRPDSLDELARLRDCL